MRTKLVVKLCSVTICFAVGTVLVGLWLLTNPVVHADSHPRAVRADPQRLMTDVRMLTALTPSRSVANVNSLDRAASLITEAFAKTGCRVRSDPFEVGGFEYRNVICAVGPVSAPLLVFGAHYDVYGDANPGADDNASGVAGILELARLLHANAPALKHRIELVAFALEEPPQFKTPDMGSHVYARRLRERRVPVEAMISVEMIGYFSDQPGSQRYPWAPMGWIYPDTGNFIGVVGSLSQLSLVARIKRHLSGDARLPVHSINAPTVIPGIDFSDHWSFWQFGLPAVMVTDTAFLRNPNYHRPTDTAETLDYERMALVVEGLYRVAVNF